MSMLLQVDYSVNPPPGYEGDIIGPLEDCDFLPVKNTDSVSIPFGRAVAWRKSGQTSDFDVRLPSAATDSIAGIVVNLKQYQPAFQVRDINGQLITIGQFDANGIIPGQMLVILRSGKVRVKVENGCAVDDRLVVRAVASGATHVVGGFTNALDTATPSTTIDCRGQGVYLRSASALGFTELVANFNNRP